MRVVTAYIGTSSGPLTVCRLWFVPSYGGAGELSWYLRRVHRCADYGSSPRFWLATGDFAVFDEQPGGCVFVRVGEYSAFVLVAGLNWDAVVPGSPGDWGVLRIID